MIPTTCAELLAAMNGKLPQGRETAFGYAATLQYYDILRIPVPPGVGAEKLACGLAWKFFLDTLAYTSYETNPKLYWRIKPRLEVTTDGSYAQLYARYLISDLPELDEATCAKEIERRIQAAPK